MTGRFILCECLCARKWHEKIPKGKGYVYGQCRRHPECQAFRFKRMLKKIQMM